MLNIVQQQIDTETQELEHPQLGEKKLEIVLPYAKDFLKLYICDEKNPTELLQHPFVSWINSPPHHTFVDAYSMIMTNNQINALTNNRLKLFFDLQFIYANTICQILGLKIHLGEEKFNAQVVPKYKERNKLYLEMQKLLGVLRLGNGGILSRQESKIHLLEKLLEDILSNDVEHNRNFFNATSAHALFLREIMTKKLMHGLYLIYQKYDLEPSFISNIALNMLCIFFKPMDSSDASEWAKEIKLLVDEDAKFRQQTIGHYLGVPS